MSGTDWNRLLWALDANRKPANALADLPNWTNSLPSPSRTAPSNRLGLFDLVPQERSPFDFRSPPATPRLPTNGATESRSAPVTLPEVKRKVYFAFSFSDVLRVNNVRQVGKVGPREIRNARTFFDRSIWERRSIKQDEGLKNLMRNGVKYSSAVCVLIGTDTWNSRWVKYERTRRDRWTRLIQRPHQQPQSSCSQNASLGLQSAALDGRLQRCKQRILSLGEARSRKKCGDARAWMGVAAVQGLYRPDCTPRAISLELTLTGSCRCRG